MRRYFLIGFASILWSAFAESPPPGSSDGAREGRAVLRTGTDDLTVHVNYNVQAAQVQIARLGFALHAHGAPRFVQSTTVNAAHSLAYNTVIVNKTDHAHTQGRLKAWGAGENWAIARVMCNGAYAGVKLERTVAMHDNVILDVFHCRSEEPAQFDLPLHLQGAIEGLPLGQPTDVVGLEAGYQQLANAEQLPGKARVLLLRTGPDSGIRVHLGPHDALYRATDYDPLGKSRGVTLLRRIQAREAVFVAAYEVLDSLKDTPNHRLEFRQEDGTIYSTLGDTRLTIDVTALLTWPGAQYRVDEGGVIE
jgi:hypothetical protein